MRATRRPSFSIEVPGLLSYLSTGSFDGKVTGLTELNNQYERQYGKGNYLPPIEAIYWSMRGMAYAGSFVALVAVLGAFLFWKRRLERLKWFLWIGVVTSFVPFVATSFGWLLTELGRQPWIVQGLLKTSSANSPAVGTTWLAISLAVFVSLYIVLGVLDIWLMRRYAGRDPCEPGQQTPRGFAGTGGGLLMDLENLWFVLIVVLWSGYFLLEGFDFGVGMLLPFLPRDDDERDAMFASIGPVWDGNEGPRSRPPRRARGPRRSRRPPRRR